MRPPRMSVEAARKLMAELKGYRPEYSKVISLDECPEAARPWLRYWVRATAWYIGSGGVSFGGSEVPVLQAMLKAQFGSTLNPPPPSPASVAPQPPTPKSNSGPAGDELESLSETPFFSSRDRHPWLVATLVAGKAAMECGTKERASERLAMIKRLAGTGKFYLPSVDFDKLEAFGHLTASFPNFKPVIDTFVSDLSFSIVLKKPLHLAPTLLIGPPGIGKTHFVDAMSTVLGFSMTMRSMAEMSGGFILTGSHSTWSSSSVGLIAQMVADTEARKAPLFLIDELDKCTATYHRSPLAPLLGILEERTAQRFLDEFLQLEMDITPVSWLFTANSLDTIPGPIRSRLRIIHVEEPTRQQMPAIVRSVDRGIRKQKPQMDEAFAPLSDELIRHLEKMAPRELAQVLLGGYAQCARRLRDLDYCHREVLLSDLPECRPKREPRKFNPDLH